MAKNEAKILFTAETTEFNKSIKEADKQMKELRAETKLNETQMKKTGTTVEGLEKTHTLLGNQLKAQQAKTEALNSKMKKAVEIFGANSDEASRLRVQVLNSQEAEAKLEKSIADCNKRIDEQKEAAEEAARAQQEQAEATEKAAREQAEAERATNKLTDEIETQQTELTQLKKKYADLVLEGKENTEEAERLASEIEDLSQELKQSKTAFDEAAEKADKLDKSMENAGDSAQKSEEGFTVAKGAIANLASKAVELAIGKVSEFIGYLKELPEATREFRQDMATLETSYETAGFSVEQATGTWKELYKVFGEDDRAVEAANLISKFADNQKDLNDWVTITKGVWGSYQDSLPVEGLAEASNETAKVGQVTGVLADALNWNSEAAKMFSKYMSEDVTTAEDAFNEALKECTTEEERQALITETLTKLYGGAAEEYEKASGAQTKAKEATAEHILVENEMADAIEPVTTAWQGMKTQLLSAVLPAVQKVSGFLAKNPVVLKAVAVAVTVLSVALGAIAIAWGVYTAAQWVANAALLACPITWIVAAIVALIAVIIVIVAYWDELKAAGVACWDAIKNACKVAWDWIKNTVSSFVSWVNSNIIQPIVKFFTNLWTSIKNIWNNICNAVQVAIMFIGSIISAAWNIITLPFRFIWENCRDTVVKIFTKIKTHVSEALEKIREFFVKAKQKIQNAWASVTQFFSKIWSGIKSAFEPVGNWFSDKFKKAKTGVQNAWSSVKGFFSKIWSGIKSTFSNVKGWFSDKFTQAKTGVQNAWAKVKDAIMKPINAAKDGIKNALDKIKGFFSGLKLKFPNIKLPHFSIKGKFSLDPPSVPKLAIDWYAKAVTSPMIMNSPTIFGYSNGRFLGGGEAGSEMIGGTNTVMQMIQSAVDRSMQSMNIGALAAAVEDLANRPIKMNINGRQFALATAGDSDRVNGMRNRLTDRGVLLD